jgi:hypothetical protein
MMLASEDSNRVPGAPAKRIFIVRIYDKPYCATIEPKGSNVM